MHQDREIRQESYLVTKYEKARQDVGLFYVIDNKKFIYFKESVRTLLTTSKPISGSLNFIDIPDLI